MSPTMAKCSTWAFIMSEPPGRLFSALDDLLNVGLIPHVVVVQDGYRISCGVFNDAELAQFQQIAELYAYHVGVYLLP